jgi:hypothetical protein
MTDLDRLHARLSQTPAVLRGLLTDAPADALAFREAPRTWTPLEVLFHVMDGEIDDWMPRVRVIMSDAADKRFAPFDREAGMRRYAGWTAAAALDEFDRLRRESLDALAALHLAPADLARTGIHPEFGRVTLDQLLACWVTHDLAHVAQIARVMVRYQGPAVGPWSKYFSLLNAPT